MVETDPTRVPLALPPAPTVKVQAAEGASDFQVPTHEPTTEPAITVYTGPRVPEMLRRSLIALVAASEGTFRWSDEEQPNDRAVGLVLTESKPLVSWLYAAAAPFTTIQDGITADEIRQGWRQGRASAGVLIVEEETAAVFSASWGPIGTEAQIVPNGAIVEALWSTRPSWTLLPFHRLRPELKVLAVDGQNPLHDDFDANGYPMSVFFGLEGEPSAVESLVAGWSGPTSNRQADQLTHVAMTGVTALGRGTAFQMEVRGVTAPADEIGPILAAADITHISHEVPFATGCPYPNPVGTPIFCARDSYLELLKAVGADVVELTGNHVNDWGPDNLIHSIDLYESAGMKTFGGGRDLASALEPVLIEHNDNRIAFIGCNPVGPPYAWATDSRAGSLPCDMPAFKAQIERLNESGYLVIATQQYHEFYHYAPTAQQRIDFRSLAEAGAAAVSGSQGHHAQGFDFHQGSFIHFGLGNLFFDQMDMLGTRQSFADIYTIYQGRLLSVELVTSLIESFCCPRMMTPAERETVLESLFTASGW